ncbi:MAG: hypothetical protein ABI577_14930 [bacterium]
MAMVERGNAWRFEALGKSDHGSVSGTEWDVSILDYEPCHSFRVERDRENEIELGALGDEGRLIEWTEITGD